MKTQKLMALALVLAATVGVAAQGGGKPTTGNPTPGTAQPPAPNLADRITLTGCLRAAPEKPGGVASEAADPNTPSDARHVLTNAAREKRVPVGTGESELAAGPSSLTYRLDAIDSQLSPFVGTKVEISGEVLPPSGAAGTSASDGPTLHVEFVQKIAATCP